MKNRIVFAVGGTGGHIFPAVNAAEKMEVSPLFIGSGLATNPYFKQRFSYRDIPSATLFGKNRLLAPLKLLYGCVLSLFHLLRFRPDLLVGFGSFHSFPVLFAAKLLGKPYLLFEPNAKIGRVNRFFAKKSKAIFSPFSHPYPQTQYTAIPIKTQDCSKKEALKFFGFTEEKRTLLIFGGSQGAHSLNLCCLKALSCLKESLQIVHIIGHHTQQSLVETAYATMHHTAIVKPFETAMNIAMIAADVAICRAGAATIGELMHYKLPALLVPYPHETDGHQTANSAQFVSIGGGMAIQEKDLDLNALLQNLLEKRAFFRHNLEKIKRPPTLDERIAQYL